MGRITRDIYKGRNGRAGKDAGKGQRVEVSGSGFAFCLNPGVRVCLTSVGRGGSPCTRIRVSSLPRVALPVEQVWRSGSGPSHHIQETFEITLPAPADSRPTSSAVFWSLKPLNSNAIWLDDRFMGPRISPFLPRRVDCLLRKGYRTRMDMLCTQPYRTKRDPRLIDDDASIPRWQPPISVYLLPLSPPPPPFPPLPRPDPSRMPLWPNRFGHHVKLVFVINIDETYSKLLRPISLDQVATTRQPRDHSCSATTDAVGPPPQCISRGIRVRAMKKINKKYQTRSLHSPAPVEVSKQTKHADTPNHPSPCSGVYGSPSPCAGTAMGGLIDDRAPLDGSTDDQRRKARKRWTIHFVVLHPSRSRAETVAGVANDAILRIVRSTNLSFQILSRPCADTDHNFLYTRQDP